MRDGMDRRGWLALAAGSAAALVTRPAWAVVAAQAENPLTSFTGPEANPYWNSVGPYVTYPQKLPLLRLTDRPIQLETPRAYFLAQRSRPTRRSMCVITFPTFPTPSISRPGGWTSAATSSGRCN